MNYNKYVSTAGLDSIALQKIFDCLENMNGKTINILEFGSGHSTDFLVDYKFYSNKNIIIDSYDNDINYCYKNKKNNAFLNLNVNPLISCNDEDYHKLLEQGEYDASYFHLHNMLPYNHPKFWRQKNCFYQIENLREHYDLVIIDGPNGNGRNIAYLHIKDRVKKNSIIFIDDYNSKDGDYDYEFIPNLKKLINVEEIYTHNKAIQPTWKNGGFFAIYKVI